MFVGVTHFFNNEESEEISAFKGLAQTSPYLALLITAGLFSLAGMPLLVGFFTKFILFQAIVSAGHLGLVVVGRQGAQAESAQTSGHCPGNAIDAPRHSG